MQLKLKEDPAEWRRFACALTVVVAAITAAAWWRGALSAGTAVLACTSAVVLWALGWRYPRLLRPIYRAGMTVGFYLGRVMGLFWLVILFWLAIVPIAVVLKLLGIDPLRWRRPPTGSSDGSSDGSSYWVQSAPYQSLRRMF